MLIVGGFVVCSKLSDSTPAPICVHPTLQGAADWLIAFWQDGESGALSPKYDSDFYCVVEYTGGTPTGLRWRVEADSSTTTI